MFIYISNTNYINRWGGAVFDSFYRLGRGTSSSQNWPKGRIWQLAHTIPQEILHYICTYDTLYILIIIIMYVYIYIYIYTYLHNTYIHNTHIWEKRWRDKPAMMMKAMAYI